MKISINLGGLTMTITVLLCILKLAGVLNISWLWCFSMIWLPIAFFVSLICLAALVVIIVSLVEVIFKS